MDDRLGTNREFEIRDDDRPDDRPYPRKRHFGTVLFIAAALMLVLVAALILWRFGTGVPGGASVPGGPIRP